MASTSSIKQPRPPTGYRSLKVEPGEVLLHLTISNKCGQAFRWRGMAVWDNQKGNDIETPIIKSEDHVEIKKENLETSSFVPSTLETKPIINQELNGNGSQVVDEKSETEWSLCLSDRVILLRQDVERGYLYFNALQPSSSSENGATSDQNRDELLRSTELWLKDYLNLQVPLDEMYKEWAEKDKVFARFATRFAGIRMLRQDPWECLCAFICSSNNNIARIGQMVQKLATNYSEPMIEYTYPAAPSIKSESTDPDPEIISTPTKIIYHPFPSPSRLAQPGVEEELRILGFGYRAKYIARTAQMLCEENSEKFKLEQEEKEKQRLEKKGKGKGKRNEIEMLSSTSTTPTSTESNQEIETEIEYSNNGRTKRARKSVNNNLTTISSSLSSVKKKGQGKVETSTKTSSLNVLPKSKAKTDVIDYGKDIDSKVYKFLFSLRSLSYSEAKEKLIVYQGVGPKVADCILLMSLDQPSSIPVDRHVFAFASKWYGIKTTRYDEVADAFREIWGSEWAGWAHSVLFAADLKAFQDYQPEGVKKEEVLEEVEIPIVGGVEGKGFEKIKKEEERVD